MPLKMLFQLSKCILGFGIPLLTESRDLFPHGRFFVFQRFCWIDSSFFHAYMVFFMRTQLAFHFNLLHMSRGQILDLNTLE